MRGEPFLLDTSAAIAFLMKAHPAHAAMRAWGSGRRLRLATHSLAETYSVLTRLPGDARVEPHDAVRLIDSVFESAAPVSDPADVHRELARLGVVGGAVYDGLVALAARDAGLTLITRDARAIPTYQAVGVRAQVVA